MSNKYHQLVNGVPCLMYEINGKDAVHNHSTPNNNGDHHGE